MPQELDDDIMRARAKFYLVAQQLCAEGLKGLIPMRFPVAHLGRVPRNSQLPCVRVG